MIRFQLTILTITVIIFASNVGNSLANLIYEPPYGIGQSSCRTRCFRFELYVFKIYDKS